MDELKDRISKLTPAQRRLLEIRIAQGIDSTHAIEEQVINKCGMGGPYPLSYNQQGMWIFNNLEPDSPVYNTPKAFYFKGELKYEALSKALHEIVSRHSILRTVYQMMGSGPVQIVLDDWSFEIQLVDLVELEDRKKEKEQRRLIGLETRKPFDLTKDWAFRVVLLRMAVDEHVLLLLSHHIASDNWSTGVLYKELSALYNAFSRNEQSPLSELPIQYFDYSVWQQTRMKDRQLQDQLKYWQEKLKDLPAPLELPSDFPRPKAKNYTASSRSLILPQGLVDSLSEFSQRNKGTIFMALLAGFYILLFRWTGQKDILIGIPVAGRMHLETEGLIGNFINIIVARLELDETFTFVDFFRQVRQMALEAYTNQELPYEKLVEELAPERSGGYTPFFRVLFDSVRTHTRELDLHGIQTRWLDLGFRRTIFDLIFYIQESEGSLTILCEYNADIFTGETVERMLHQYQTLLEAIVEDPETQIGLLPLMKSRERQRLLLDFTDNPIDFQAEKCIHQIIEEVADKNPDSTAVVYVDTTLTYGELDTKANRLARFLISLGIGPDDLVGIFVERSLDMIVAVLGVLKAGGAYVPLDPAYPEKQLDYIVSDAQFKVMLTQTHLIPRITNHKPVIVDLDSDRDKIDTFSAERLDYAGHLDNLAYVIYTSGTTGTPKGVMISQRELAWYAQAVSRVFEIEPRDRALQFASFSFDASVEEIFPSFFVGATLVLRNDEMLKSVEHFLETCEAWGITVLNLTTSFWHELAYGLKTASLQLPKCIRLVIFGGESVLAERVENWFEQVDESVILWNTYGPTETTVGASFHQLAGQLNSANRENPYNAESIGAPISGAEIYILDNFLQPVPIGIPGELYIGGYGLGRGYFNDPERTAEKFVPHPFSTSGGERLFRTGDLARYKADGNIQFLGRADRQVKIRGYRIELEQIEVVIDQHPSVHQVAVLVHETRSRDRSLVGYIVPAVTNDFKISDLREYLNLRLPEYMIPSRFVILDAFPLTTSGKIDRQSLQKVESINTSEAQVHTAPSSPVESAIAMIWSDVLGLDDVGLQDDFFKLGGHSLLVMRMVPMVENLFQVKLPLRLVFEVSILGEFADAVIRETGGIEKAEQRAFLLLDLEEGPDNGSG